MKANEAPEKIYLEISHPFGKDEYTQMVGFEDKVNSDDVEYVHADAFIDKALAYLNDKFYFNNVFYGIVSTEFNAMEEMYEDFKNYMKGE